MRAAATDDLHDNTQHYEQRARVYMYTQSIRLATIAPSGNGRQCAHKDNIKSDKIKFYNNISYIFNKNYIHRNIKRLILLKHDRVSQIPFIAGVENLHP